MQIESTIPYLPSVASTVQSSGVVRQLSTSSLRSLSDIPLLSSAASFTSSTGSIPFEDEEVDVVTEEGLRHADMTLEAR